MGIFDFFKRKKVPLERDIPVKPPMTTNNLFSENLGNEWLYRDYEKTEKYFLDQESINIGNTYSLHFTYNKLIKFYYKHRNDKVDAIDKCIYVCQKDIDLMPDFIEIWKKENPTYNFLPSIPSFKHLAIIYDQQGKFDEAIQVCEKALSFRLDDGTKGGYASRIQKIKKKAGIA